MNALMFAKDNVIDCILYTYPFMPCNRCFVHMVQAGIKRFVAPKPTDEQLTRWGAAFEKTKLYAKEVGATILEVKY